MAETQLFLCDCIGMPKEHVESFSHMVYFDNRTEKIEPQEFLKHVDRLYLQHRIHENHMPYDNVDELINDWHVTWWRGWFGDVRCYYFSWSAIEYLFTVDGEWPTPWMYNEEHT